jgi:hypothetical protein
MTVISPKLLRCSWQQIPFLEKAIGKEHKGLDRTPAGGKLGA